MLYSYTFNDRMHYFLENVNFVVLHILIQILILDKWPNCVCKRTSSFDRPHLFYRVLLKFATLRKWRAEEEKEQQHMNLHSEACITLALTYHRQYRTFQNLYHVCRSTFITKWFPIARLLYIYTVEICSLYLCKL